MGRKMQEEMLTLEKFEEASEIVKKVTLETKLVYSDYFSAQTGNRVYLKPENLQFTGAYKLRGAYYKMSTLTDEERAKGLITASQATMPRAWLMRQNATAARQPS
ncbi:threonine dehydratase, medium form [human gut metagenome]|uniref:Threonine dehydratase, medium form n=1 Tax=human gut metagenome TaxID=408170 RepID=K1RN46_9ZZZZ